MSENYKQIHEKIENLRKLREEQLKLLDALSYSVSLKEFMPDAHDRGRCKPYVIGNLSDPRKMRFVIELANGESREFPVTEVPEALLPDSVIRALNPNRRK